MVNVGTFLFQAQFGASYSPSAFSASAFYPSISYPYGDRSCPVSLLWELSSIVQKLYGFGRDPYNPPEYNPYGGFAGNNLYGAFSGLSSGRGFQTTTSLAGNYNPTCPWPLINGLISQIQQYVNQLQSATTGTGTNPYPFPFAAQPPLGRGSPFGLFRGVKK